MFWTILVCGLSLFIGLMGADTLLNPIFSKPVASFILAKCQEFNAFLLLIVGAGLLLYIVLKAFGRMVGRGSKAH